MGRPVQRFSATDEVYGELEPLSDIFTDGSKSELINMCVYYFVQSSKEQKDIIHRTWVDRKKKK